MTESGKEISSLGELKNQIYIHHFAEQHFIGLAWALSKVSDLDLVLGLGHSKQSTNTH